MKKMNRRQALKTIVAATGAVTAISFMPAKWVKPVVKSGVVPAHAQASGDVFEAEAIALDSDFLPWTEPLELGNGHSYIGHIQARLGAPLDLVPSASYCFNVTVTSNNVELMWQWMDGQPNLPMPIGSAWSTLPNIAIIWGLQDDIVTMRFDLVDCATPGTILQSISIVFTLVEYIGGSK